MNSTPRGVLTDLSDLSWPPISEVRRWRRAATALVLAGVAVATIGATIPRGRIVEARKFVLRDAAGRVRAELGVMRDGEPRIALLDARGGTAWKAP